MSSLWERWHELSKRGGLDVAGCQMLADWKREADQLRAQLQEREAVLREALEKILTAETDTDRWGGHISETGKIAQQALSSPSQPLNRVAELEAQNAALREALEEVNSILPDKRYFSRDITSIKEKVNRALSSPSQPSRYREIRPEVQWFAGEMEKQLKANDHKGGWKECELDWLFDRLIEETHEIRHELHKQWNGPLKRATLQQIIKESSDVANFAMMIADIALAAYDKAGEGAGK